MQNVSFNISDLGIAAGSAAAVAADHRIDNRIMYSVGMGAIRMGCFPNDVVYAYGIPLSATNKSVFFDRDNEAILNSYSEKIKEDGFTFTRLFYFSLLNTTCNVIPNSMMHRPTTEYGVISSPRNT